MSAARKPREMRRADRDDVSFCCEVIPDDGPGFSGLIVNISPFGCLTRATQAHVAGKLLCFDLPVAGRRSARVIWSLGGRMGVEFNRPIEADLYRAMLETMSRSGDDMGIY
jgi:hypothetical protein